MLWYTLERYAACLLGHSFIRLEGEEKVSPTAEKPLPPHVALTPQELLGLKAIVLYLHQLPIARKNVPALIADPVALLRAVRQIVETHRYDDPKAAVTGRPILVWPGERPDVNKQTNYSKIRQKKGQNSYMYFSSLGCR
jgi:F-box/leucine-rich repeat protein 10/11